MENDKIHINLNEEIKEETTFNKLKNLQILLKKESALKGLYSETGKNTQNDIETLSKEIFQKKTEVLNVLKNGPYSNNIKNFVLVKDNKDYLKTLYLYIPKMLTYLWENPKIIAKLLLNSNNSDIQTYLAPLICNNFYENILSSNFIEEPLIYVIYILLEDEINKLKDVNDCEKFLNNTPCGYLLDELFYKKEVKEFFKIIFKDIIEILELSSGDNQLSFDPLRIEKFLIDRRNSLKKNMKKQSSKKFNFIVDSQRQRTEEENKFHEIFFTNYLKDLNLESLKDLKNKYISENNKIMEDYIDFQLKGKTNPDVYSNKEFFRLMNNNSLYSYEILISYEKSFIKAINFIDSLLNTLVENLDLFPSSIKFICQIISSLLDKKFKNITIFEKNIFISQFLLNKLLLPMLVSPANGAYINNYIISNTTLQNLHIISQIISQFLSFKLFDSEEKGVYSPFNFYFLKNMTKVMEIYDSISKVKLPKLISKLINEEISLDSFEYNYFEENKNEILFHRSIFLSMNDIQILINNINKNGELIYNNDNIEFKLIMNKLIDNKDNVKFIKSLCENNNAKIKRAIKFRGKKEEIIEQNIKYMLFNDIIYNEKYKKLLSFQHVAPYFKLEEKKIIASKDNKENKEVIENTIIKTKNVISTLLYNYRSLIESDFQDGKTNNTIEIFKKLKLFMKSAGFVVDERIPSDWYIELLFEYLKKLPPEYKEKDFDKLYKELKNDIEKSIKQYNFEELSVIISKKKFGKKIKSYYNDIKEILQDINLNISINKIIETEEINVKIFFKYNDEKKELSIYKEDRGEKQLDFLDSFIFAGNNQKPKLCKTILSFTKHFPDLNKYTTNKLDSMDIFEIQRRLNVPHQLNIFFDIIKEHLKNNLKKEEKEIDIIFNKVYDYVMSKIYQKIYPLEPDPMDLSLTKKTQIFSWIEPKNLIKDNYNYNFELVLPDITKYFNLIDIEKSPRKKILNMNNIFEAINSLLQFSQNSTVIGVDNQMPLLNYIFIKAKPKRMLTNYEFMELYIGEKIQKNEGNYMAQLKSIMDFTFGLTPNQLFNITQKEFEENCLSTSMEEETKQEEKRFY